MTDLISPRVGILNRLPEVIQKATAALLPAHTRQALDGRDGLPESLRTHATNLSGIGATIRDLVKNVAFEQY